MPLGTIVHNVELNPGQGGKFARSAGTYAQLALPRKVKYAVLKMPSGEVRMVLASMSVQQLERYRTQSTS